MFNPVEKLTNEFIKRFMQNSNNFLVSQSYERGLDPFNDTNKIGLMFTEYPNYEEAKKHFDTLKRDKFRAIINLEKDEHRNKIIEMLAENSKYVLYTTLVKSQADVDRRLNAKYRNNVRRYISQKTNWHIGGNSTVYPKLEIQAGNLMVKMQYGKYQEIVISLEELENT